MGIGEKALVARHAGTPSRRCTCGAGIHAGQTRGGIRPAGWASSPAGAAVESCDSAVVQPRRRAVPAETARDQADTTAARADHCASRSARCCRTAGSWPVGRAGGCCGGGIPDFASDRRAAANDGPGCRGRSGLSDAAPAGGRCDRPFGGSRRRAIRCPDCGGGRDVGAGASGGCPQRPERSTRSLRRECNWAQRAAWTLRRRRDRAPRRAGKCWPDWPSTVRLGVRRQARRHAHLLTFHRDAIAVL